VSGAFPSGGGGGGGGGGAGGNGTEGEGEGGMPVVEAYPLVEAEPAPEAAPAERRRRLLAVPKPGYDVKRRLQVRGAGVYGLGLGEFGGCAGSESWC